MAEQDDPEQDDPEAGELAEPLAVQEHHFPDSDLTVAVGVHSPEVSGETMTVRVSLTPLEASDGAETVSLVDLTTVHRMLPTVVGRENLKECRVIRDGATWWSASAGRLRTAPGEPMVWWDVYAAPEDTVDAVDIRVFDNLPEFTDVPVEW
ncbi:hypothetical protein GCM10027061_19240 [Nesterenkonia suensis]